LVFSVVELTAEKPPFAIEFAPLCQIESATATARLSQNKSIRLADLFIWVRFVCGVHLTSIESRHLVAKVVQRVFTGHWLETPILEACRSYSISESSALKSKVVYERLMDVFEHTSQNDESMNYFRASPPACRTKRIMAVYDLLEGEVVDAEHKVIRAYAEILSGWQLSNPFEYEILEDFASDHMGIRLLRRESRKKLMTPTMNLLAERASKIQRYTAVERISVLPAPVAAKLRSVYEDQRLKGNYNRKLEESLKTLRAAFESYSADEQSEACKRALAFFKNVTYKNLHKQSTIARAPSSATYPWSVTGGRALGGVAAALPGGAQKRPFDPVPSDAPETQAKKAKNH